MEVKITPWYEAYEYLALQLNQFYTSHLNEAGTKLFDLCINSDEFCDKNKWINKFSSVFEISSLDPLHIFASVSGNTSTPESRLKRINILLGLLQDNNQGTFYDHSSVFYSKIDVTGCPATMPVKLLSARQHEEQEDIWLFFHNAFQYGHDGLDDDIFSLSKQWYGVSGRIITILLFWIKPNTFLPLDKNTVALLQEHGKIIKFPKSVIEYKELLVSQDTSLYRTLTLVAYSPENFENLPSEEKSSYYQYIGKNLGSFKEGESTSTITAFNPRVVIGASQNNCKLISLRPLPSCNPKFLKSLKVYELYKLHQNFSDDNNEVIYNSNQNEGLFDVDGLKINISAIVGKNGTGKSTIIELFIIAFNNLAYKKLRDVNDSPVIWVENIYLEFFFETNALYKVILRNTEIEIVTYESVGNEKYNEISIENISEFKFDNLFYTTLINYSLHGLNSENCGHWLDKLFHKNDGYQTPIVIEPLRSKGVIDINRQDLLIKQRLLVNILEEEDADNDSFSLRNLKSGMKADFLKLSLNPSKYAADTENNRRRDLNPNLSITDKTELITTLLNKFEVENFNVSTFDPSSDEINNVAQCYIVNKLFKISYRYDKYKKYFKQPENIIVDVPEFINKLEQDNSHITYKLRQAIYFLKFKTYQQEDWGKISLENTANKLAKILSELQVNYPLAKLDYLLPPPFFNVDIFLNNQIEFSGLSSGEKQKIYSINSILYHLKNIDSVAEISDIDVQKIYKYNYVNFFLDEVELCFHPELQRTFIDDLRKSLIKCFPAYIYGINICFVTHSPFVLSDIPKQNILFLESDEKTLMTIPYNDCKGTFAANIHDLLTDGFFMNSSIGAFAESVITDIVTFHQQVLNSMEPLKLKDDFLKKRVKFKFILDVIADEYIKGVIKSHLKEIELELGIGVSKGIDDEISVLELQLAKLKMEKENHAPD